MCGTGLGTGAYKGDRIAECQNAGTSSETQDRWGSKVQAIKKSLYLIFIMLPKSFYKEFKYTFIHIHKS